MHVRILSFGGGVQTTALAIINALVKARREGRKASVPASLRGLIARADDLDICADEIVFADVADGQADEEWPGESPATHAAIEHLNEWLSSYGLGITTVSAGHLFRWAWDHRLIPVTYGGQRGNGRRQCTHKFKIVPIQRYLRPRCVPPEVESRFRQWVGRAVITARREVEDTPRQLSLFGEAKPKERRIPLLDRWRPNWRELAWRELGFGDGWGLTTQLGISVDEIERVKPAREWWVRNRHPLVELGLRRSDCVSVITAVGLPVPPRSACEFCPLQPFSRWRELAERRPQVFRRAAELEARCNERRAALGKYPIYLTSTGRPLSQAVGEDGTGRRMMLPGLGDLAVTAAECEGYCFV